MTLKKATIFIILILLIDQVSKLYIKTHFIIGERVVVFDWFEIAFVENDGMAWGTKLSDFASFISDRVAKLCLTLFRIIAIFGIGYWLVKSVKKKAATSLLIAIVLIFAGALGNILDSVFYGVLFSSSVHELATFLPEAGGYESVFHGNVVDMLHFPMFSGEYPEWLPFLGGQTFSFFDPVFNVADMAISTGIGVLIVFNKQAFPKDEESVTVENAPLNQALENE